MRSRLNYANVVATLALFIALGGASAFAAAQLAKNTVGTRQLMKNAVTGAKVRDQSLTGSDIDTSTLGTVPKATSADSADLRPTPIMRNLPATPAPSRGVRQVRLSTVTPRYSPRAAIFRSATASS